ncbi:MAG: helix-turn-helix domain-containing protein [Oscillospiraceae bacterium]
MIRRTKRLKMEIIEENAPPSLSEYIVQCINEKGMKRSELIRALNIDRNYGYQILNGTRTPTRKQIIHIGLFLGLELAQVQKMLTLGERDVLYVRRPEDARIVHCIEHHIEYEQACEFIWGDDS